MADPRPISDFLDKQLRETLEKLPPSSGRGFLEASVTTDGAQVEVGSKLGPRWAVSGWAGLQWKGHPIAGARVKGSW